MNRGITIVGILALVLAVLLASPISNSAAQQNNPQGETRSATAVPSTTGTATTTATASPSAPTTATPSVTATSTSATVTPTTSPTGLCHVAVNVLRIGPADQGRDINVQLNANGTLGFTVGTNRVIDYESTKPDGQTIGSFTVPKAPVVQAQFTITLVQPPGIGEWPAVTERYNQPVDCPGKVTITDRFTAPGGKFIDIKLRVVVTDP